MVLREQIQSWDIWSVGLVNRWWHKKRVLRVGHLKPDLHLKSLKNIPNTKQRPLVILSLGQLFFFAYLTSRIILQSFIQTTASLFLHFGLIIRILTPFDVNQIMRGKTTNKNSKIL